MANTRGWWWSARRGKDAARGVRAALTEAGATATITQAE
jgi:hypothetical protein